MHQCIQAYSAYIGDKMRGVLTWGTTPTMRTEGVENMAFTALWLRGDLHAPCGQAIRSKYNCAWLIHCHQPVMITKVAAAGQHADMWQH